MVEESARRDEEENQKEGTQRLGRIARFWDEKLKPKLAEVLKREDLDGASKFYLSQAAWYVEHDLADGRSPKIRLLQAQGTLNDQSFYDNVIKDNIELEEALREVATLIGELMGLED